MARQAQALQSIGAEVQVIQASSAESFTAMS